MENSFEEASFASIVLRMATGAYISLGLVENPTTGEKKKDLKTTEYLIDSLRVLREKTKGNLEKEEEGYLTQVISDLELNFVKAKEKK
ncbi:MAG: DUF1844 domain-containing protein [candidate division WOR-3 bacterium]|nr:DUF1844 domain-containing protein [candidate division WOR-3 bacterium]